MSENSPYPTDTPDVIDSTPEQSPLVDTVVELRPAAERVETLRSGGRSRLAKVVLVGGATVVLATILVAGGAVAVDQAQKASTKRVADAKEQAKARQEVERIQYLRQETVTGRKYAERASHWAATEKLSRKALISCLLAMEQWLGDEAKVRAYERDHKASHSVNDVSERLEDEKIRDGVAASAAKLREKLEAEGPLVIEGGRRVFY